METKEINNSQNLNNAIKYFQSWLYDQDETSEVWRHTYFILKALKDEEHAKDVLRGKGHYVDNLWHVNDVTNLDECEDKSEAYGILDEVLTSERIQSEIFETIKQTI